MISRMIPLILVAALMFSGSACDPYSDPPSTTNPDTPAESWRGTYTGRCLLTCASGGSWFPLVCRNRLPFTQVFQGW